MAYGRPVHPVNSERPTSPVSNVPTLSQHPPFRRLFIQDRPGSWSVFYGSLSCFRNILPIDKKGSVFCFTNIFSTIYSFLLQSLPVKIIHDSLGYQAAGNHGGRHASARMCTRANEVQIFIARMPIGWSEVSHLRQRMS